MLTSPTAWLRPLVLATLALAPLTASAQADQGRLGRSELVRSTAPGYYVYHQPGEATIQVSVEGAVVNPGLYEVAVGTELDRLLALSGGAQVDARQPDQRQRVEVRLFRPEVGQVYAATTQDLSSNPAPVPALREGDSLIVEVVTRR
ncbi:MAG: SLBB domain-containing protein, partial [Bacteroidota bacterium]